MEEARNRLLVVSAHPGDVLWRCAGAVAKHVKEGGEARIISLSYGIAGESVALWKQEGMTAEKAKQIRVEQMENAAKVLGASCEIWDLPEYPFRPTIEDMYRLAAVLRTYQPGIVLTHHDSDPLNPDHGLILDFVKNAVEIAGADGIRIEGTVPGFDRPEIYCFEPHASEASDFKPNVFIDITDVWEVKDAAMACMPDKAGIRKAYTERAILRATNAKSFGRKGCKYAEAYRAFLPFARGGGFPR